jgi:hypothetical protein
LGLLTAALAAEIGRGSFANSDVIRGAVGMQFLMPLLDEFALDACCGRTCWADGSKKGDDNLFKKYGDQ